MISDLERELIERAVKLRAFVRQVDAPSLYKLLSEHADFLLQLQKREAKQREDIEPLVRALEDFVLKTQDLNTEAGNIIRRYRLNNPRRD